MIILEENFKLRGFCIWTLHIFKSLSV